MSRGRNSKKKPIIANNFGFQLTSSDLLVPWSPDTQVDYSTPIGLNEVGKKFKEKSMMENNFYF